MARKITVSFKETTKDIELYSYLVSLEEKSSEIKQLIKLGIKAKNNKEGKNNE